MTRIPQDSSVPFHLAHTPPAAPPPRPVDGHKGLFGTVIVIGGGALMLGAPALAATAALRAGAGLVKIAMPASLLPHVLTIEPSATGIPLEPPESRNSLRPWLSDLQGVLAVGPGMGGGTAQQTLVHAVMQSHQPLVLDADGLNNLALLRILGLWTSTPRQGPLVLTPHPGEFTRLAEAADMHDLDATDPARRPAAAKALARAYRAVILLKGRHTLVTDGERQYINPTGNVAMATAGSGDVLTGLIAGLMGQGMEAFEAACLGAFVHGLAGDLWAAAHGESGLLACELAALIPDAMRLCRKSMEPRA